MAALIAPIAAKSMPNPGPSKQNPDTAQTPEPPGTAGQSGSAAAAPSTTLPTTQLTMLPTDALTTLPTAASVNSNVPAPGQKARPTIRTSASGTSQGIPANNQSDTRSLAAEILGTLVPSKQDLPELPGASESKGNKATAQPDASDVSPQAGVTPPASDSTPPAPVVSAMRQDQSGSPASLSFAANIQASSSASVDSSDNQSQRLVLNQSVATVASAWRKAQQDEQTAEAASVNPSSPAPLSSQTDAALSTATLSTSAPPGVTSAPDGPKHDDTPLLSAAKEVIPAVQPQPNGQLRDLSFNVAQPGGSSVQLRMVERGGELRVAVHSASPDLNQELRADLPDLSKKLSDTGFHSELWRPAMHATASGDAQATKNQGGNPGGDSPSQSGSQQGRGQRGQNQSQRPKWVEEFENGMQTASSSTGDTHGFGS